MKKILVIMILSGLVVYLYPIVPGYNGARSLALGYAGSAFSYDVNVVFINPSLLSSLTYSMTGYQYQNSYMDYKNFTDILSEVLDYNLSYYEVIEASEKSILFSKLQDLFSSKSGIYGFSSNVPGFVIRNYGISYSTVNTAIINPVTPPEENGTGFFDKVPESLSNGDIASLQMNFIGLHYNRISVSYSLPITRNINFGVCFHYLKGKVTEFNSSITNDIFSAGSSAKDYLELAWDRADEKFSKIIFDLAVSMDVGRYFKLALVTKNVGDPKITTPEREIILKRRVIAGLAFRPNQQWGIYLDMDINETELLYNGEEIQPISFGIEKGFFNNRFFLRAGFLNDLTEKHFFGSKSNVLYGFGLGFNMGKIVVDFALALDGNGSINSLAISGFVLFK